MLGNPNYSTDLNENKLSVYCVDLLQTRQRDFNGEYILVPTEAGTFEVQGSVICEEYSSREEFRLKVVVGEG